MGAEIDRLEVQVEAEALKASRSLDGLIGKLNTLSGSLSRINGGSLSGLSAGVNRLASSMQNFKNIGTADFTRLAKNIQKIGSIDTASLNRAASSMHQLSKGFSQLNTIPMSDSVKQIAELASGIKQLGYKSSTNAIENIPKLADAMKKLMASLSTAPKVSQNLIDMTNALAKLSRTGASSGKAANSLSASLNTFTRATGRASKGSHSLAASFGKLYASYWLLFRAFGKLGDAINISSGLTEVQNVVDVTFGKYSKLADEMAKTYIPQFGMSELTVKKISSRFQAMGTAMGFTQGKMADMSINLTRLAADMASFYNVEQADVAEDLESIFTGQTRPLRTYGLDLTQATLQEWALKNGLDANIKSMSQAEKTMLRYQYVLANTGAAQGDFLRTQGTWANQARILKQNFEQLASVIGGTLVNALKPLIKALNNAMIHIISFAKVISDALGQIFGWTYDEGGGLTNDFEDAADSASDLAGSTGKAAKNVEKIQKGLRAFDELNVINLPDATDGGSGGGAGGGAGDGAGGSAGGGKWTQTDSMFKKITSDIKTLEQLGETIGQSLTKAMSSIDWESIYKKAEGFGSGLASFLNGLFKSDKGGNNVFSALGTTIAGSLNTVLHGLDSFGETFDWKQFGESLATGIKNFFKTWDAGLTAETFSTFVKGILEAMTSFVKKLNADDVFEEIGQKLVDLICGIDWGGLTWDLYDFFVSLSDMIAELPVDFGKGVLEGILERIFGKEVEIKMPGWLKKAIKEMLFNSIPGMNFIDLIQKPQEIKKSLDKISDKIEKWVEEDVKPLFTKEKWKENIGSIKVALKEKWDEAVKYWKVKEKLQKVKTTYENIKEKVKGKWDETIKYWKTKGKLEQVKTTYEDFKSKISSAWSKVQEYWRDKKPLKEIKAGVMNIKSAVKLKWDAFKKWWDGLKLSFPKIKLPKFKLTGEFSLMPPSVPKIGLEWPQYAQGGFPEDGWFRANHGEMMGKFDDGRSVVANNKQITEGISIAVQEGNRENNALMRQEISLLQRQNDLLVGILQKETGITQSDIGKAARDYARDYHKRTGNPAYSF